MERRPRRQLWSGESYDSDPEDGQNQRSVNDQVATNSDKEVSLYLHHLHVHKTFFGMICSAFAFLCASALDEV